MLGTKHLVKTSIPPPVPTFSQKITLQPNTLCYIATYQYFVTLIFLYIAILVNNSTPLTQVHSNVFTTTPLRKTRFYNEKKIFRLKLPVLYSVFFKALKNYFHYHLKNPAYGRH